jgi:hypothetical protein
MYRSRILPSSDLDFLSNKISGSKLGLNFVKKNGNNFALLYRKKANNFSDEIVIAFLDTNEKYFFDNYQQFVQTFFQTSMGNM